MPKPAVVYLLLAAGFLLLLTSSRPPPRHGQRHAAGRRLAHLPPHPHHHHHAAFDPLVNQVERRAEERGLDAGSLNDKILRLNAELGNLEAYFWEEGELNITERLAYLFPLLDRSPRDGAISFEELEIWNQRQAMERLQYSTERRMRAHDQDGDWQVTLQEFLSHVPQQERDFNDMKQGKAGWWKEQFMNADTDGNGALNGTEFNDFLHPEDSRNPKIHMWLQMEKIREMDRDQDGRLSFMEFRDKAHSIYNYYPDFGDDKDDEQHHLTNAEYNFKELDVNKDEYLTADELKPILHRLYPGEFSYATYYTKYLMHEADENKDGKLTLDEMLNHHHAFYNSVIEESPDDDDDDYFDYYIRDEF